jgi:hypothetical protein
MLLLVSTSDEIRLTTGDTSSIDVQADWADNLAAVVTPGRTNTTLASPGTNAIVPSPAASTARTVKGLSIRNRHATAACLITLIHRASGPVDTELLSLKLGPGQSLVYDEHAGFMLLSSPWGAARAARERAWTAPAVGALYSCVLQSDLVNANATANRAADIPSLAFPVMEGSSYWFQFSLMYSSAATTTGSRWNVYGPSGVTAIRMHSDYSLTTTSKTSNEGTSAYDSPAGPNASSAATGANSALVEGFIDTATCDGLVFGRFASEVAASAITLKAGSVLRWMRVI